MMNLDDFRIKSSRRDPEYAVFEVNGKIVRKISAAQIDTLRRIEEGGIFFPQVLETKVVDALPEEFYEVEKIPFIVFPYELPFQLYKDYALFYLKLLKKALWYGSSLKDATPFNIAYLGKGKFYHFDLGSLENHKTETGWKGYRQFLAEFYFPLLYLTENTGIYSTDLFKVLFDKQWIYHYKFGWKNYLNAAFNINLVFFKNSRVKKLSDKHPVKKNKISKNQVDRNIILLEEAIKKFELPKVKTKWDDYYSQTVLQDGYVLKKEKVVKHFSEQIRSLSIVNYAIDWGANDGKFSKLILETFTKATVLSIESDYNAINQLYLKCRSEKVIPIYTDLLNLSPNLGFDGERQSLKNRLSEVADVQLCLGLIHHLIHQENLSFEKVIEFFASCAKPKSFFIIEFIDEEDPRHQLIKNPNYPYALSRDFFVESLNTHYEVLDAKEVISTREIFLCRRREQPRKEYVR